MKGKSLDVTSEPIAHSASPNPEEADAGFLGVTFECCGAYARVYRNRAGDAYEGRCPRCLRPIRFGIGPGGTSNKFFTAS